MTANNDDQNNSIAPIQDGSVPFVPFAKPSSNQGGATVAGSPESGPIKINATETNSGTPEYGYDAIKLIEQKAEQEALANETAEKKESKSPIPSKIPQDDQQKKLAEEKKELPAPEVVKAEFPKFQGHKVPEEIIADPEKIKAEVGKGDANKSQTAVYIFLDRLLKKQSANGK
jgi:hypothetical protein